MLCFCTIDSPVITREGLASAHRPNSMRQTMQQLRKISHYFLLGLGLGERHSLLALGLGRLGARCRELLDVGILVTGTLALP